MTWLLLEGYRGKFERIYVFSPTINLDPTWDPVKKYVRENLAVDDKEEWAFDNFDEQALQNILDTQARVTA